MKMKFISILGGLASAALAVGLSSAASAAIVVTTYNGTIVSGQDSAGLAGAADTNLAGLSYTAVFAIDTSVNPVGGPAYTGLTPFPWELVRADSSSTPLISAVFTVNGTPLSLPGHESFYAVTAETVELQYGVENPGADSYYFNLRFSPDIPGHFATAFSASGNPSSYAFVDFYSDRGDLELTTYMSIASVSSRVVGGAVPEPATWALMILGFGSAGAMLRRRRVACV